MDGFVSLFLYYAAIVFGFQYAELLFDFVESFFGFTSVPSKTITGALILGTAFFLVTSGIKKKLPAFSDKSNCLVNLVFIWAAGWLTWQLLIKTLVYLGYMTPMDFVKFFGTPDTYGPRAQSLLRSENWVDHLIQFWFPPSEPYAMYGILKKMLLGGG